LGKPSFRQVGNERKRRVEKTAGPEVQLRKRVFQVKQAALQETLEHESTNGRMPHKY